MEWEEEEETMLRQHRTNTQTPRREAAEEEIGMTWW